MRRGEGLSDSETDKYDIVKIPKQVIKMMRRGEGLSDSETDYCKNPQTSNKNYDERRKPL